MKSLAQGPNLESRAFALEVALAEVGLAEGEVDELASGLEDSESF